MEWNSIKTAQQFLQQANALHPEEEKGNAGFEKLLARQDLFYECYMMCFTREKLIEFLNGAVGGNVKMPEEPEGIDEARYRDAYAQEALKILNDVNG
jgi:hypothetical protein